MALIDLLVYTFLGISLIGNAYFFSKFKQIRPFFDVMTKGGVLCVIKTQLGDRKFDRAIRHGNSLHSERFGIYQLTGAPDELERFYGMNTYFGHEITSIKPDKEGKLALALLEKAISDPANKDLVKEAVFRADGVLSKAIREPTFMSYQKVAYDSDGNIKTKEDGTPEFDTVTVKYPSLISVLVSEYWANILKRMIGIFQNPYEIKEVIHITEIETIEKMKSDKGFSELMKWILPIVIIIIVGALAFKMISMGAGSGVVETVTSSASNIKI